MSYDYAPEAVERWDYLAQATYWRMQAQHLERTCHYWKTQAQAASGAAK